jgi:hypothetical protein
MRPPGRIATAASATTPPPSRRCSSICSSTPTRSRRRASRSDLDATDDPIHGRQEGRFFHGYYDCYCYLPLYIFCGDHLLAAKLRRANIDASAGATEEVARIVTQIRARWPRVKILLRADSGFARDALMAWCEANRVDFLFGLARNARLVDHIHVDLAWAEDEAERAGRPARRFADFRWRTRDSWSRKRRVVAKAEWMPGRGERGANPRFVVTSLPATEIGARALYERLYCARGDMENRIKECQLDLFADRTSAATMRANQLRLWFASMAYVLMAALRRRALAHTRLASGHLRHDPAQAPQDRRPGYPQRPAHPHRHGQRLPLCRRLRARPCPIMPLIPPRAPANPSHQRPRPHAHDPRDHRGGEACNHVRLIGVKRH